MPLPPVPHVVKLQYTGNIGGTPFANIFHFGYAATAPSSADLDTACADQMLTSGPWGGDIAPLLSTDISLTAVTAEDLTSSTSAVGSASGSLPGLSGGNILAASTCVLAKHLISRRYRGGHPRTYFPPSDQTHLATPNSWTTSWISNWQTNVAAFFADIASLMPSASAPWIHVNVSYFSGGAMRVTPVVDPITGSVVETKVATQRRRIGR